MNEPSFPCRAVRCAPLRRGFVGGGRRNLQAKPVGLDLAIGPAINGFGHFLASLLASLGVELPMNTKENSAAVVVVNSLLNIAEVVGATRDDLRPKIVHSNTIEFIGRKLIDSR